MKLVFYSDQIIPENRKVDDCLLGLLPLGARIGYVPSGSDPDRKFFEDRQAYYTHLGLSLDVFCDLRALSVGSLASLLDCDAIHLSGGDTRNFLDGLTQAGMLDMLRRWARSGGTLIGTSAGAILMTPIIAVDAIFRGANPSEAASTEALNLVQFEFLPHLNKSPDFLPALVRYSRTNGRPIFGCPDGDGIVVDGDAIEFIGKIVRVEDGAVSPE